MEKLKLKSEATRSEHMSHVDVLLGDSFEFRKKGVRKKKPDYFYVSNRPVEEGCFCLFYGQLSQVTSVANGSAKLTTVTVMSEEDAELFNSMKKNNKYAEGYLGIMKHGFDASKLPRIEATNNERLIALGIPSIRKMDFFGGDFCACEKIDGKLVPIIEEGHLVKYTGNPNIEEALNKLKNNSEVVSYLEKQLQERSQKMFDDSKEIGDVHEFSFERWKATIDWFKENGGEIIPYISALGYEQGKYYPQYMLRLKAGEAILDMPSFVTKPGYGKSSYKHCLKHGREYHFRHNQIFDYPEQLQEYRKALAYAYKTFGSELFWEREVFAYPERAPHYDDFKTLRITDKQRAMEKAMEKLESEMEGLI